MKFKWFLLVLVSLSWIGGVMAVPVENAGSPPAQSSPGAPALNVNTAGVDELASLPGVGPALAKRIIEYRTANGPFTKAEDLLAVKGIGAKLLARIKDRLSFSAPVGKR